jgi:hypothetical protein
VKKTNQRKNTIINIGRVVVAKANTNKPINEYSKDEAWKKRAIQKKDRDSKKNERVSERACGAIKVNVG